MGLLDIFTGIASAAVSLATKVAPAVGKFVNGFMKIAPKLPGGDIFRVIDIACKIVKGISKLLKTGSKEDTMIVGMKAEKSDKCIEDFGSVDEYIKHLEKDIEIDKSEIKKLSKEDKAVYKSVGMGIEIKAVEEKMGVEEISPECVATFSKLEMNNSFSAEEILFIMNSLKAAGINDMNALSDYLEGRSGEDTVKIGNALMEATLELKKNNPDEYIKSLKKGVRKTEEE